jgi:hypothetical protein
MLVSIVLLLYMYILAADTAAWLRGTAKGGAEVTPV